MRESVTAIFVHDDDIFIIKRQEYLRAFPGYYAFPGGKIDAADSEHRYSHPLMSAFPGEQMRALTRELEEELGYDLEASVEAGEVESIVHFGLAQTPAFQKIRFSTHYFKITFNHRPLLQPDNQEIAWSGWLKNKALWQRYCCGEGMMVTPTANTVQALSEDISAVGTLPFNLEYDSERELPYVEPISGLGQIAVPSNTLPPAEYTNALLIGGVGHPRYLVDPSPKSSIVLERLVNTLERRPIDGILISHHHPDHREQAPQLARRLGVPLLCTRITRERLLKREGEGYLENVECIDIAEGHKLTLWLGRPVHCYELPGHDDGMMGLAPDDMAWFFVSDLVQQMATVVIPEPEGDMQAYFDSLERVIGLNPKAIIPSHGTAVGGTHMLRQTLQHRQGREVMVASLCAQGKMAEEITETIYPGLDKKLLPLALQNVRQHIKKLGLDTNGSDLS
ncbi:MAG: MBL fold metallo-hydrolase [Candidatus Sedimenticola sp. (ex Thyasira tokunagai)]